MENRPLSLDDIKQLVALFEAHRLVELEVRDEGIRIRLAAARLAPGDLHEDDRDRGPYADISPYAEHGPAGGALPAPRDSGEPGFEERGWLPLHAPMTGTFYRKPTPDEPNFVETGGPVEEDQIVGLIEAMKIFSEIRSEVTGTVMELPVPTGQMVQAGQVLAWIAPDASPDAGARE